MNVLDMKDRPVFSLDLGSSKVALLASSLDEQGQICVHEVANIPCRGVTRGVVTDLDLTREIADSVSVPSPW